MSIQAAMAAAAARLEYRKKMDCWRQDIRLWAKERLGVHLWSKQVEIASSTTRRSR